VKKRHFVLKGLRGDPMKEREDKWRERDVRAWALVKKRDNNCKARQR